MTSIEPLAGTLRTPWPFTGRERELELVRRCLAAGRPGLVVTGPAGCGRTRLAREAVRGADCARVAGSPGLAGVRDLPFAAFAHLLPEGVTLHRAVRLLCGVRLLVVDDAQLLDDASAALLHQLAVHGHTRLLVLVADDAPVPAAVSRLWSGELLPRLALGALSREETARLLTDGPDGPVEPLTVRRLHRLCRGDLRLLRDLLEAVRERRPPNRDPDRRTAESPARDGGRNPASNPPQQAVRDPDRDTGQDTDRESGDGSWAWRGPIPLTPALRERAVAVLARPRPDERDVLDRLAFAEPLPLPSDAFDARALERLEADGLLDVVDGTGVRLAHPLHGPALRAAAGPLRARRLSRARPPVAPALAAEAARLARRIERVDVRATPTPVGEWLLAEGEAVPPWYAAVHARFSRLRGELREAAAWAREGLAGTPHDTACRIELALAAAQSGETGELIDPLAAHPGTAPWAPAARGDLDAARKTLPLPDSRTAPAAAADCARACPDAVPQGSAAADAPAAAGRGLRQARSDGLPEGCGSPVAGEVGAAGAGDRRGHAGADGGVKALAPSTQGDADPVASRPGVGTAPSCGGGGPAADGPGPHRPARGCAVDDPYTVYDAVRLGVPEAAVRVLPAGGVLALHARALAGADGPALDAAAAELAERGLLLFAAEAYAQAARVHRDPGAARTARARAAALARRCQGARTPALAGLALGELTARQRQIVALAAQGLSNRQIAERLTLSVRTVGNHLHGAYTRLGADDRACLPGLLELPEGQRA
ncbi:LuxR C-terminal-related transcriptional regulator [Streptomyces sp. NPDC021608]|uniref:helix-turn-helix transcriptional regulator n=1 Tax=Streptomyces sp. NPDC021608 TaxID=3154903 RepID=UPI0034086DC2